MQLRALFLLMAVVFGFASLSPALVQVQAEWESHHVADSTADCHGDSHFPHEESSHGPSERNHACCHVASFVLTLVPFWNLPLVEDKDYVELVLSAWPEPFLEGPFQPPRHRLIS